MLRRALLLLAIASVTAAAPKPDTGPPPLPYVAHGACPFECCTYGPWQALIAFAVHPRERDEREVSFRLAPGDSLLAITGNVHVLRPGLVLVRRSFDAAQDSGIVHFTTGDSIWLLDNYGEGAQNAWHHGRQITASIEWWYETEGPSEWDPRPPGRLVRQAKAEWWVQIRDAKGRTGWIRIPDDDLGMDGADACG